MLLSDKESLEHKDNPVKASSELNYYPKGRPSNADFNRRRQFLGPRFSNPILPASMKLGGLNYPNRNLIPDLMALQPSQDIKNFNVRHLGDLSPFQKTSKLGRPLKLIKSPKSEMNNYLIRGQKSQGKGQTGHDFSAIVSVKDYKDNISNQDGLSRRVKGEPLTNNVFYQNSSNNLPSNNISDHNFKSSILSFKDNQNDMANLSANAKPDDPMVVLQSLRLKGAAHGFYKASPMNFNAHFQYGNEPSFVPVHEPQHLPTINKLVNLKQVSFEKHNKRNMSSPQLARKRTVFHPIFPKKAVRPSATSNNEELLMPGNDLSGAKSPPFLPSVDRETQILPTYNYSAKLTNFHALLKPNFPRKPNAGAHWEVQQVG